MFALFVMGAWIAGTIIVGVVASENFYTIDRLLAASANPTFMSVADRLGHVQTRDLLRYLSSELNRLYFQVWNVTQLGVGIVALWLLGADRVHARARWGVASMLAIVAVMMTWLTPQIVSAGRSLDFVPRDPAPAALGRFWVLHGIYISLEGVKLVIGVIVSVSIARRASRHEALTSNAL